MIYKPFVAFFVASHYIIFYIHLLLFRFLTFTTFVAMNNTVKKIIAVIAGAFALGLLPAISLLIPLILLLSSSAKDELFDKLEDLKVDNGGNDKFVRFLEKIQGML